MASGPPLPIVGEKKILSKFAIDTLETSLSRSVFTDSIPAYPELLRETVPFRHPRELLASVQEEIGLDDLSLQFEESVALYQTTKLESLEPVRTLIERQIQLVREEDCFTTVDKTTMDWAVFKEGMTGPKILVILVLGEKIDWADMGTSINRLQEEATSLREMLTIGFHIYFWVCLYGALYLAKKLFPIFWIYGLTSFDNT